MSKLNNTLLNTTRAAVMVFFTLISIGCSTAVEKDEPTETVEEIANEIRAMGLYCVIKNRNLQDDPKYSRFYSIVKDDFSRINCGNYGVINEEGK